MILRREEVEFDVNPAAKSYYDRMTLELAIQIAKERIEEWSYNDDPHGYCHERPVLIALIAAARAWLEPNYEAAQEVYENQRPGVGPVTDRKRVKAIVDAALQETEE
jgi:hypothetical protein